MITTLLFIFKIIGILVTSTLAIVNLVVGFKDPDGKITVWGRRALWFTIVSSLLTTSTVFIEEWRSRDSAAKAKEIAEADKAKLATLLNLTNGQLRNSEVTFGEVQRILTVISDIDVEVEFQAEVKHMPDLRKYLIDLDTRIDSKGKVARGIRRNQVLWDWITIRRSFESPVLPQL